MPTTTDNHNSEPVKNSRDTELDRLAYNLLSPPTTGGGQTERLERQRRILHLHFEEHFASLPQKQRPVMQWIGGGLALATSALAWAMVASILYYLFKTN